MKQIVTDSENDPILDSNGGEIFTEGLGFEGFVQMVFELRTLVMNTQTQLKSLEDRVSALEAKHNSAP